MTGPSVEESAAAASMAENGNGAAMSKSASYLDVRSVEGAVGIPPLKRSKLNTVVNLLEAKKAVQVSQ